MKKEIVKRIFDFLEAKGEHIIPLPVKINLAMPIAKEELNVKGDLNFRYSNLTSLPEGLKVGGYLILHMCKNITSLPKGLKVGGDLDLAKTNIKSLPEGLEVGGDLDLRLTDITSLPKGLKVHSNLYIRVLAKYSHGELREMIKPGFIKGEIYN